MISTYKAQDAGSLKTRKDIISSFKQHKKRNKILKEVRKKVKGGMKKYSIILVIQITLILLITTISLLLSLIINLKYQPKSEVHPNNQNQEYPYHRFISATSDSLCPSHILSYLIYPVPQPCDSLNTTLKVWARGHHHPSRRSRPVSDAVSKS